MSHIATPSQSIPLSQLSEQQKALVRACSARGALKQKLLNMGFIPGAEIMMIRNAPLRDPIEIGIQNYFLSLRRSEAQMIQVEQL
ncbi:FeoA family protein [uncultured Desulfuromonas sp.]|uniref:FeoA family protein n=1 Tax=uncultured Desulfuromonas sp. TaxID=181013 RepID=UPI002AAB09DD|nr:FeoA family protein [uncultured Desulfuromonas sp.]